MKVPFVLRRLQTGRPATGLLLHGQDPAKLLALCARLGSESRPCVYSVADGFLLQLPAPTHSIYPGTLRLRNLAENLLLPVDAELIPALLDDEARGLVSQRGLVFLPGGRVLQFAPGEPIAVASLVDAGPIERESWQALPAPREWPVRIAYLGLEIPDPPAEDVLEAGREGIGTESPRPDNSGVGSKSLGQAGLLAGQALAGLGSLLHLSWLTRMGTALMSRALALAPRLSEQIFGRQEAALRWLLHEFREGNLEKALRRALPMSGPGQRGQAPRGGFHLPFHNLLYSLRNLFAGSQHVDVWYGGRDFQSELRDEYRKAAEAAAAKGDCRRAAYIYGKLLNDFRSAANVLLQGGLAHDAAILYLTILGDRRAAAAAFAAAGEIDHALALYREEGEHLLAGDLLRRAGEEEAAVLEYQIAAEDIVTRRQDYLAAGQLLWHRGERPDLAAGYFASGWSRRPTRNDVACAMKLATLHAAQGAAQALLDLMTEGECYLASEGSDAEAGQFFNSIAKLAEQPSLTGVCEELRDRSLFHLGARLRRRAQIETRPVNLVSDLLGHKGIWDAAIVSDADFALKAALKRPALTKRAGRSPEDLIRLQIGGGIVASACYAPGAGDIFLGFHTGEIFCFRPSHSEVLRLPGSPSGCVSSLTTDDSAQTVVALRELDPGTQTLTSYVLTAAEEYRLEGTVVCGDAESCLTPLILHQQLLGTWNQARLSFLRGALLVSQGALEEPAGEFLDMSSVLLVPDRQSHGKDLAAVIFCPSSIWYAAGLHPGPRSWLAQSWQQGRLDWTPCIPENNSLRSVPIAWMQSGARQLELVGLSMSGTLHWSLLQPAPTKEDGDETSGVLRIPAHNAAVRPDGYLAATLIRPGHVAGVSRTQIDWLRAGSKDFTSWAVTKADLSTAVACFPSYRTAELIVICRDGAAVRVPVPG